MEIYFSDNYNNNDLFLLEVPNDLIEYIKTIKENNNNNNNNNELIIKGIEPTILCTNDKNFEVKFLDTTNTFLVLSNENSTNNDKLNISLLTNHTLECQELTPKKYFIYNLLKKNCSLNYDLKTGLNNFNSFDKKFTIDECFAISDLPRKKFNEMLIKENILIYLNKYLCVFNENFLFELLTDLLKLISFKDKIIFFDENECFDLLNFEKEKKYEMLLKNITKEEKKFILNFISDIDENGVSLNKEKCKLFIAKNLFKNNKNNNNNNNNFEYTFKLNQFVTLFKNSIVLYLPTEISTKIQTENNNYLVNNDCSDNLYEFYKDYDLRFLKGHCLIYSDSSFRNPLIRWIEISELKDNFDERIKQLFNIKDKWSQKEIEIFMEDLELGNVLNDKIMRITQTVNEKNIFDNNIKFTSFYLKKNPFFIK